MREAEQKIEIKRQIERERRKQNKQEAERDRKASRKFNWNIHSLLMMAGTSRNRTKKSEEHKVAKVKEVAKVPKLKHSETKYKEAIVVSPTRTRFESRDNRKIENNPLATFGIIPAPRILFSRSKEAKLKCCVVETPQVNSIIFCFEPNNPNSSNWSEKILLDFINKEATWTKDLNFDDICYTWFKRLKKQMNNKGYGTRLFAINIATAPPTEEVLQEIGCLVCKHVNKAPENKIVVSVDKRDFI